MADDHEVHDSLYSPIVAVHAIIGQGILDLQNAVTIISGSEVAGKGKVVIKPEWLSLQVVSDDVDRRQQPQEEEFIVAELRLRKAGCVHYDYQCKGSEQRLRGFGISLAEFEEFLKTATDQHRLSIIYKPYERMSTLKLELHDISAPVNVEPLDINVDPPLTLEEAESSSSPSLSRCGRRVSPLVATGDLTQSLWFYTTELATEEPGDEDSDPEDPVPLASAKLRTTTRTFDPLEAPRLLVVDETLYTVTATIPSQLFFDILKRLGYSIASNLKIDAPVLQITLSKTDLVFDYSGTNVTLKQESGGFKIESDTAFDDEFSLRFRLAILKPLQEAERMPGTGRVSVHAGGPQGCKPLLNCPVGAGGELGNLFFSGL